MGCGVGFQDANDEDNIAPRWSECRCVHCGPLLMPMSLATERLCVLSEESFRAKEAELSDTPLRAPLKWSSHEVSLKKGTVVYPLGSPFPLPSKASGEYSHIPSSPSSRVFCSHEMPTRWFNKTPAKRI